MLTPRLIDAWPEAEWMAFTGREVGDELTETRLARDMQIVELPVSPSTRVRRARRADAPAGRGGQGAHRPASQPECVDSGRRSHLNRRDRSPRHLSAAPRPHAGLLSRGMTLLVPATARRPSRLIVDTEAVGVDLRQLLGVPAGTIDVVPLGPRLDPVADATPEVELRACSDAPSPPELARDAAHRFDPRSTAAIAETVRRLLADPELRMHLACGGRTRVRRFSWERAAAETVAVYRHALAG